MHRFRRSAIRLAVAMIPLIAAVAMGMSLSLVSIAMVTAKSTSSATVGNRFSHIPFVPARQNGISLTAKLIQEEKR